MLNFQAFRDKQITLAELVADLTRDDLAALTNESVDAALAAIAGCIDADVTFVPVDPQRNDPYAATPEEVDIAWTLGHVVVHATASSEESAALAAELARGVAFHGRSRYETPWTEMHTLADCRQRLEESRRMRLASLDMWPDAPHLDNECQAWPNGPQVNAVGRFLLGLMHEDEHLGQMREIVRQARIARGAPATE
ncbi:MAG: DinB superfamily protein [Chloroflexi bacterium ADurb.Bin325]|nr:MAG: DinB superfamily protein [Chloroflexi bacterium ADurb.Bin325]